MQRGAKGVTKANALRGLLEQPGPVVAPGVYDALSARTVEQAGFAAAFVSGAAVGASLLGLPDLGLMTMTESLAQTARIAAAVDIPVIADCDTGYGNPLNVHRTVEEFERSGVAALFIEDQTTPKRCGHFDGKELITIEEMVQKVRAAVDARRDPDLVLIIRTDAIAEEGLDGAVARALAYVKAGADMIFVEAPRNRAELASLPTRIPAPLMVNLVEGGVTPLLTVDELSSLGYRLISYSGTLQKAAMKTFESVLAELSASGSLEGLYPSRVASLARRSELLGVAAWRELEGRYITRGSGSE